MFNHDRQVVFFISCLLVIAAVAGIGCLNIVEELSLRQWAAYDFDHQVTPKDGTPSKIKAFTMRETHSLAGEEWQYTAAGTVAAQHDNVQIQTIRKDSSSNSETVVTNTIECHKVEHHVTVDYTNSAEPYPEWADVTLWFSLGTVKGEDDYFWIYTKASYHDSDGNAGLWSYYLSDAMKAERQSNPNISFEPYTEGDLYGFDEGVFWGLYGWIWQGFKLFSEGGILFLRSIDLSADNYDFSCNPTTSNVGQYEFEAWALTLTYDGSQFEGTVCPDLPLPIHVAVTLSPEYDSRHFTYDLVSVTLE